jgi:mRNA interferase RelE/StbE
MPYTVILKPGARRQIKKLPKPVQDKITHALAELKMNPRPHGAKNYKVLKKFALRVGNYRVIYEIKDPSLMIFVIRVGDRKEIYREYG